MVETLSREFRVCVYVCVDDTQELLNRQQKTVFATRNPFVTLLSESGRIAHKLLRTSPTPTPSIPSSPSLIDHYNSLSLSLSWGIRVSGMPASPTCLPSSSTHTTTPRCSSPTRTTLACRQGKVNFPHPWRRKYEPESARARSVAAFVAHHLGQR